MKHVARSIDRPFVGCQYIVNNYRHGSSYVRKVYRTYRINIFSYYLVVYNTRYCLCCGYIVNTHKPPIFSLFTLRIYCSFCISRCRVNNWYCHWCIRGSNKQQKWWQESIFTLANNMTRSAQFTAQSSLESIISNEGGGKKAFAQ